MHAMSAFGTSEGTTTTRQEPLCVDLDGTLVRTNLLWESLVQLLKERPWLALLVPLWLCRGRAHLKHQLASRLSLHLDSIPYRAEVLEFLRAEKARGRRLLLVTAADQALAEDIAAHLGIFDGVYGSRPGLNLKGRNKAEFLVRSFGERGFDYIGDSRAELPVWRKAGAAYVVGNGSLLRTARRDATVVRHFETSGSPLRASLSSLRLHHWSKNLLVFVPVLLAHRMDWLPWREALLAFFVFGLCASGLYILNDLLDLHSDRSHPWKRRRPFASGELPLWLGIVTSALLVGGSLLFSAAVSRRLAAVLLAYSVVTVLYSWKLKTVALLDVFVLAGFYAFRVWAGGVVSATPLSRWFLVFSAFFFLSLAMAKRNSELLHAGELVEEGNSGRGYLLRDRELLTTFGVASCFAAVVILALYTQSADVYPLYHAPSRLLLLCPLVLYWLSRVWLRAVRGELREDPVTFALRDVVSWVLAGAAAAVLLFSNLVVH